MHLATSLIIAFIFPFSTLAQITFERNYGGTESEVCFSAHQILDGGYIIAGYTKSYGAGENDVYLIKTKTNGDTLWTRTYDGKDYDGGSSVQQTSDSGYVITGGTYSFGLGEGDVYLVKTKANGDTLWTRTYGGKDYDGGSSVQQTSDGGYIIAGETKSFGAGKFDVYLIKTDTKGDTMWTRTYGGTEFDLGGSVQPTTDGGYIITGQTFSFGREKFDVCLIKTDINGNTIWTRTYTDGVENNNAGFSVQQTSDGGYIIAGFTQSPPLHDSDVYLIKTNANGDTMWTHTYGGTNWDCNGRSIQKTSDGGYIIAGSTRHFDVGNNDVFLLKTDANGDTIWTRTYSGSELDFGYSVQQCSDDGYVIAGVTMSLGGGDRDMYLIKTDATGLIAR